MRKVCIFTSTRADWGLLHGVAEEVEKHPDLELQLLASGTHLSDKFGMTVSEIEGDGFVINERVDILKFNDSPEGICKTMGLALPEYGQALTRTGPDMLLLLGDRYETLCVAIAAQLLRIPIAHIHGGETTEGAVDEAFRHSITKMAHLHFPCCETYRQRIIQLGENPAHVFNVGSLGTENIRKIPLMSKDDLESSINFVLDRPFFLITYHPVTLEQATAAKQVDALFEALNHFPDHKMIITHANADADGQMINTLIEHYSKQHSDRCLSITSLGLVRYLSAMNLCETVIGNSSSGILETPAFKKPTVNIGNRQKGRIRADNIIDSKADASSIITAIHQAISADFNRSLANMSNPFGKEHTARKIVKTINAAGFDELLIKSFYALKESSRV